jgi:hypothetical protein
MTYLACQLNLSSSMTLADRPIHALIILEIGIEFLSIRSMITLGAKWFGSTGRRDEARLRAQYVLERENCYYRKQEVRQQVRSGTLLIPRCFMMLRKETMTPEMGWSSAVAFPRRSALTILRSASFRIRRPIAIPCPRPVDLLASPSAAAAAAALPLSLLTSSRRLSLSLSLSLASEGREASAPLRNPGWARVET